ncbi:MAG: HK97 gp10 family phage protein [Bacteroidota bacterium]
MHLTTKLKGIKKAKLGINRYGNHYTRSVQQKVFKAGVTAVRTAKTRCPVDTGRLRSSIQLSMSNDRLVAKMHTNVSYAIPVEFGTASQGSQPFFRPGARAGIEELNKSLR